MNLQYSIYTVHSENIGDLVYCAPVLFKVALQMLNKVLTHHLRLF